MLVRFFSFYNKFIVFLSRKILKVYYTIFTFRFVRQYWIIQCKLQNIRSTPVENYTQFKWVLYLYHSIFLFTFFILFIGECWVAIQIPFKIKVLYNVWRKTIILRITIHRYYIECNYSKTIELNFYLYEIIMNKKWFS